MAESHRDEITKLEALYSDNPEGRVFTLLAEAYRKAGELDRAREVLEGGIKRHTGYASAFVVLGRVLLDQQQGPAAEDAFRRVLELDPENLVALRALGDRARTTGRHQEAIKYYHELLMLDPSDEELQASVATLQKELGAKEAESAAQPQVAADAGWNAPVAEASGARDSQVTSDGDFGNISIDSGGLSLPDSANYGDISMQSGSGNMLSLNDDATEDLGGSFSLDTSDAAFTGLGGDLGSTDLGGSSAGVEAPAGDFGTLPDFGGFSLDQGTDDLGGASQGAADAGGHVGLPPLSFEPLDEASVGATDLPLLDEPPTEALPAEALSFAADPIDMLDAPIPGESLSEPSFRPFAPGVEEPAAFPFTTDGVVEETAPPLEGWSPEAADASPAAAAAADSFAAIPDVDEDAPWQPPADAPGGELATETMAELYTTQGLHDRAAEVYRTLLLARPDDERLYTKLRQAEFAHSSSQVVKEPPPAPEAPAASAPPQEEIEPESAWTAAPSTAGQEETPYAWADEEEADTGPQIGQYFSALLSWRSVTPRPRRVEPVTGQPRAAVPEAAPPLAEPEPPKQSAARAAAEADTDLSWLDEPEPVVAETPAPSAPAAPVSAAAQSAPAPEDDLAWLFDDEPAAAAGAPSPEASSTKQAGAAEPEGGDDDDLEMFRAWLQSLKR